MKIFIFNKESLCPHRASGFSLIEVIMSLAISVFMVGAIAYGYTMAAKQAEWAARSLAAQSLAMQVLERVKVARWEPNADPQVDQVTSAFFPSTIEHLQLPTSNTNLLLATNFVTITTVSINPPLKMIRVDCGWSFHNHNGSTNTLIAYRAPDQ